MNQRLLIVLLFALTSSSMWAQSATTFDPADDLQTTNLKGLSAVGVVVSELNPDLESTGLTEDQIKADTESRLRKSGIRILNGRERLNTAGQPYLHIVIDTSCDNLTNSCTFYVGLRLVERTHLERDSTIRTYSSTWARESALMTVRRDHLGDDIRALLNEFFEQFQKALQAANA